WAIVAGALLGATTGTAMVICHGQIQQSTPPAVLGRVTALLSLATLGLSPLTYGAAGAIAAASGTAVFFALAAGVLVLAGLTLTRARFSAPVDSPLHMGSDAESSRWDHRAMTATWDERIDAFWSAADDAQPDATVEAMRALVAERAEGDPDAAYEWASVHDYLGMEQQAIPLYRAALDGGLGGARRPQAVIQLASSLRNVGEPEAAVELLRQQPSDEVVGDAARAFLALALRDSGRHDEALATALLALAPTLPLYRRAVESYAAELGEQDAPHR
ncbi:MAG: tetratricopeptide repeat protein, partial [Actinomycetes bacterium]